MTSNGALPRLNGDGRRFKQVLMNLVKNALKFTTEGSIVIKSSYSNGLLVVNVEDTGTGIAREDMSKLFTRFGKL